MPNTLILGGSGRVAHHLTRLLVSRGHTVHSIIRSPSQIPLLQSLGAQPIVHSIEDSSVSSLADCMHSCSADIVIWSAGAGGKGGAERTKKVDEEGAIKCMDAMVEAGVSRFLMVSAIDVRDREGKPVPEWYTPEDERRSDGMWNTLGTYMRAKLEADRELRVGNERRGLKYTIVRPGTLTDEKEEGKVSAGKVHFGKSVSREDVAGVVVACIENEGTVGLAFDVLGGDMPIEEAVGRVAQEKIDTFDGHY